MKPRFRRRSLEALAAAYGIQSSFTDSAGDEHIASADALRKLLQTFGIDATSELNIDTALAEVEQQQDARAIEPVIVAWNGQVAEVRVPERFARSTVRITAIDPLDGAGEQRVVMVRPDAERKLNIPELPLGYYSAQFDEADAQPASLIISAPLKAYAHPQPKPGKGVTAPWGVFLPIYASNTDRSWGAGDFSDWETLCRHTRNAGGTVVATLPLMPAFLDSWKTEPSPYSPASRLFWNEFYVDPTRSPEFAANKAAQRIVNSSVFQSELNAVRALPVVDYTRTMALKRKVLERLAKDGFAPARKAAFEAFRAAHPEVESYAEFRAACEREKRSWHTWPERMRNGRILPRDYLEGTKQFYLYAQWLAQEQVDGLLLETEAKGPQLYFDLPLGVNPDGYDVWRHRDQFVPGANVGAPPDAFFTKGQDWGFPPLHPRRIRESGYRYVIDYLRFQMRHTGLLRIDHVMGLHRLWWVPHGSSAADGAYVRYHADEWYAILCLESHLHKTALVGENLGTVPPEVNKSMKRHGVRGMFVVQYETRPDSKAPLTEPTAESVSSINTHDMPMWAAHWDGLDIADRRELGLMEAADVSDEAERRMRLRRALVTFLKKQKLAARDAGAREVLLALVKYLRRSPTRLVLVNLEDIWLEKSPQNTPGTSTERINWARKARYKVDEIFSREEVAKFLEELSRPADS